MSEQWIRINLSLESSYKIYQNKFYAKFILKWDRIPNPNGDPENSTNRTAMSLYKNMWNKVRYYAIKQNFRFLKDKIPKILSVKPYPRQSHHVYV